MLSINEYIFDDFEARMGTFFFDKRNLLYIKLQNVSSIGSIDNYSLFSFIIQSLLEMLEIYDF